MNEESNAVVLEPPQPASATIIWLHGLGADGHDFEPIVPELGLAAVRSTRFVFPHAPHQSVTVNGGMVMRAWYDITDAEFPGQADEAGIRRSEQRLRGCIEREVASGIPAQRVVLAGFSQGGVISLRTGLTFEQRLAGIIALSTYLPMQPQTAREAHANNRDIPIFMAHGTQDPLIPLEAAQESRQFLQDNDYDVQWHTYPMAHSVSPDEIRDLSNWLAAVLA